MELNDSIIKREECIMNNELSRLIEIAMGNSNQAEFAARCNISKEHLNRMLNGKIASKPSNRTLYKIASNSNGIVSLDQLLAAVSEESLSDKNDTDSLEEKKDEFLIKDHLPDISYDRDVMAIKEAIILCRARNKLYDSVEAVCNQLISDINIGDRNYSFVIGGQNLIPKGKEYVDADYVAPVTISIEDKEFRIEVLYCITTKGKIIMRNICI